jgi:alkanesulfonate monooxygenase SsuD/methylene tetrahydromethanopterin reductase-like flavin-dependent oxidoreductase (luciferase family)
MEPKPFQKPGPPVWFGGSHPAALRRAVRYGDGFFGAGSQTTAQFAQQVQVVLGVLALNPASTLATEALAKATLARMFEGS